MSCQIRLVALTVLACLTVDCLAWQIVYDSPHNYSGPQITALKKVDVSRVLPDKTKSRVALVFDGSRDVVKADHIPFDEYETFTIEAWVRGWKGHIVAQGRHGDPENSVWLSIGTGTDPIEASGWEFDEGQNAQAVIGKYMDPFAWNHIAMIFNGEQQQFFVNGDLVYSQDAPKPGPLEESRKFRIGVQSRNTVGGKGLLGAIRVSKTVRYAMHFEPATKLRVDRDTVLQYDCMEGEGDRLTDASGNERHGTISGASWVPDDQKRFLLNLQDYRVTDSDLEKLKSAKELKILSLNNTTVTDAGIEHLKTMESLESLDLRRTYISPEGVATLGRSLPNCTIIAPDGDKPSLLDVSPSGGLFAKAQTVEIKKLASTCTVRYTLDGSPPKPDSPEYAEPLKLEKSATLNVSLFDKEGAEIQRMRREFVIDNRAKLLELGDEAWKVWDESEDVNEAPSDWSVVQNVVTQKSNIHNGSTSSRIEDDRQGSLRIYQEQEDFADGEFHFEVGSYDDDAVGAAFRVQDDQHYYLFGMDKQRKRHFLAVKNGDEYRTLMQTKRIYDVGRWHQVRIVQAGPKLTVFVNGEKTLEGEDATFDKGGIALYSWGSEGAHFRNLSYRENVDAE